MESLRPQLEEGLAALGLDLAPEQVAALLAYGALLAKWNKVYNLTAKDRSEDILRLHLLDSLAIFPYLEGATVADIGTGGGTPGLPLAIACPERRFWLLDSSTKKIRFVRQAILELGLANAQAVATRVEDFSFPGGFATIVSRAFASAADFVGITRHLIQPGGLWLAMKGRAEQAELGGLTHPWRAERLNVPGLAAERHVICIRNNA